MLIASGLTSIIGAGGVESVNAVEVVLHQLARGQLTLLHHSLQRGDIQFIEVGAWVGCAAARREQCCDHNQNKTLHPWMLPLAVEHRE